MATEDPFSYSEHLDNLNIGFHGIELRGINDNRLRELPVISHGLEEFELHSEKGVPFRVYVHKGNKKTAIVTFHDIGTNHSSFTSFFNYPEMQVLMKNFTVYHICAPGHHESAGPLGADVLKLGEHEKLLNHRSDSENQVIFTVDGRPAGSATFTYPSMDDLADLILPVMAHFEFKHFLGFGSGAGSNVLSRFGLKHPNALLGLFLLNPSCGVAGYYQWFKNKWSDLPKMHRQVLSDGLLTQLYYQWCGTNTNERDEEVLEFYEEHLKRLNLSNVAGYIESYNSRTDLGLVRPNDPTGASTTMSTAAAMTTGWFGRRKSSAGQCPPNVIKTDVFLITGSLAVEHARALADMNGRMNPSLTQFNIMPDCSGMVMDENPEKLVIAFLRFLHNIGLLVTMTAEKLVKETMQHQSTIVSDSQQKDTVVVNNGQSHTASYI